MFWGKLGRVHTGDIIDRAIDFVASVYASGDKVCKFMNIN